MASALRAGGLAGERRFERDHRVLNRACWSELRATQMLLGLLVALLPAHWQLIVAPDETLERRKGARIGAKGMYRNAVRPSRSRVVTCLGLQWV